MLVSVGLFSLLSPFLLRRGPVVSCLVNRGLAISVGEPNMGGGQRALTLPCENVYLSPVFSLSTSPFLLLHLLSHVQNPPGPIPPLALFPKRIVQWLFVQGGGGM